MNKSMKIMIAYDGSEHSEAAIHDLRLAGLPRVGKALIVTVQDALPTNSLSSLDLVEKTVISRRILSTVALLEEQTVEVLENMKKQVNEATANLSYYLPEWEIENRILSGNAARSIIHESQLWQADLTVLGSHGRTALGRFFLGSVSNEVAQNAMCPIRIARDAAIHNLNSRSRLFVPINGSPSNETVIRHIGNRVWNADAKIRLAVIEDESEITKNSAVLSKKQIMLEWAVEQLQAIGLNVSIEFVEGGEPHKLLEAAENWNANTIFIQANSSDENNLDETATNIINIAQCTVEIVR